MNDKARNESSIDAKAQCGTVITTTTLDDFHEANIEEFGGFLLMHAAHTWEQAIENALKQDGINATEFMILSVIQHLNQQQSTTNLNTVSVASGLDYDTVHEVVGELLYRDLVNWSHTHNNQRHMEFCLTHNGVRTQHHAQRQVMDSWQQMFRQHREVKSELEQTLELMYHLQC